MHPLLGYLVVFIGAGIGGVLHHAVNRAGTALLGTAFPWNTFFVNVTGCLVMGLLAGWFTFRGAGGGGQMLRLFLLTGILGGYTTFSAFSLDMALLWERGAIGPCLSYGIASVGLSILGVFSGLALIRMTVQAAGVAS